MKVTIDPINDRVHWRQFLPDNFSSLLRHRRGCAMISRYHHSQYGQCNSCEGTCQRSITHKVPRHRPSLRCVGWLGIVEPLITSHRRVVAFVSPGHVWVDLRGSANQTSKQISLSRIKTRHITHHFASSRPGNLQPPPARAEEGRLLSRPFTRILLVESASPCKVHRTGVCFCWSLCVS